MTGKNHLDFDRGPIRPPSEAASLLFRLVKNCPWNRCTFCPVYKNTRFEIRPEHDILQDIKTAARIRDEIVRTGEHYPENHPITRFDLQRILQNPCHSNAYKSVAVWLHSGSRSVFLQDADPLVLKIESIVKILAAISQHFPEVDRITAYARAKTAARIGLAGLRELKIHGLNRIHTGLESGSFAVLNAVNKGCKPVDMIKAGRAVKKAEIELCFYVMPGLGGRELWKEHALETARVVSEVDPDFIRLRTLAVIPGTKIHDRLKQGHFQMQSEDEILREIRLFIESLECARARLESDHILNLIENLEGTFPGDRQDLIKAIDAVLQLSDSRKNLFLAGKRLGIFRGLDDLNNPERRAIAEAFVHQIESAGIPFDEALMKLKTRYV